jgi:hypothetical protein
MRRALPPDAKKVETQVVRIPAAHLEKPEEVPLAITSNGEAWSLNESTSKPSRALVEQWAGRQVPPPQGSGRAVVVTLEPIEQTIVSSASQKEAAEAEAVTSDTSGSGGAQPAAATSSTGAQANHGESSTSQLEAQEVEAVTSDTSGSGGGQPKAVESSQLPPAS